MGELAPAIPDLSMLPEEVQSLRNDRERLFCWNYVWNGGNGARAARDAGYPDKSEGAKVRAHHLLTRQDVIDALRALGQRYLYSLQPKALIKLNGLLDSDNERVVTKAVDMVLSRTGLSERTAVDLNVNGQVSVVDHTKAAVADLKKLLSLGVPREKLIETFGFSGLSRYEKLLAAEEAKLIEGRVEE